MTAQKLKYIELVQKKKEEGHDLVTQNVRLHV